MSLLGLLGARISSTEKPNVFLLGKCARDEKVRDDGSVIEVMSLRGEFSSERNAFETLTLILSGNRRARTSAKD